MKQNLTSRAARVLGGAAGIVTLGAAAAPALAQYDAEVGRFNAQDALDPLPQGGVVFTGSSSIRRWEQLQLDFHDYNVIQRGLGGAFVRDITARADDIVLKYNPSAVVLFAGTNDLAYGGRDGQGVFQDYQAFVNKVHAAQPNVDIFYVGITPTPERQNNRPQEDIANNAIRNMAAGDATLHYLDIPAAFDALGAYDSPQFTNKFVDTPGLHLTRQGYDVWTGVIRPDIESVVAPNKTYVPNPDTLKVGQKLLFDFGPNNGGGGDATNGPDANGNRWNNWFDLNPVVDVTSGEHKAHLINASGADTGIRLTLTAEFKANGKQPGFLANPDPARLGDLAVATATEDYFYSSADNKRGGGDDDDGGGFMLDGLDPKLAYDFAFFGSRDNAETRITEYLVTGDNAVRTTLQTSGTGIGSDGSNINDDEIAYARGIRPDQFGQVFVDLTLVQGSFAYLNALQVTAVPEPASAVIVPALGGLLLARRPRR